MSKICFVSYEIHPTVKGGCGVLLYNAAKELLSRGHEVIFILDLPDKEFERFDKYDRLNFPLAEHCRAYSVWSMIDDMKYNRLDFHSDFEFRAYRFHHVVSKVNYLEKPDLIEFFEYLGVAYYAITAKVAGLDYLNTHVALRLHNSMELIDREQPGLNHGIDRYLMFDLEHQSLRLAETVLYPSEKFVVDGYQLYYEKWFGNLILSKPPLLEWPKNPGLEPIPNIILYYGRLVGVKGVDCFVDAATLFLSNPDNPRRQFYLIGYDSNSPPGPFVNYQAYLQSKIPEQYRSSFYFAGHYSWQQLEALLPKVLFAVIPSHIESFCYAAQELYEACIPLIVSDIAAFHDVFIDEKNALVFDGTVSDLAHQMQFLSADQHLRIKITRPYPLNLNPLSEFYDQTEYPTWINATTLEPPPSLLICLLNDNSLNLDLTLQSLRPLLSQQVNLVILNPQKSTNGDDILAWFLGKSYSFEDQKGQKLIPQQILTMDTLLILKAGDVVDASYISLALSTLQRQRQIVWVGCWKCFKKRMWSKVETFALDAATELVPFISNSVLSRVIMRTIPGKLLLDLFDPRANRFGELAYLWQLDTAETAGIMIPEVLLEYRDAEEPDLTSSSLDYLIIRDDHLWRKRRLSRLLLALEQRDRILRRHHFSELQDSKTVQLFRRIMISARQSLLNEWLDRFPWLKERLKGFAHMLRKLSYSSHRSED